ncbi:hypothetical protein [Brevundimonas sp.]|uniref:hypothetical protein n=1 Tax=Brevundimonas sp. TaxID=1871086 RepID=UPI001D5B5BA0|nr:hypothetical protein [Brevundimonas sp.]MBL0948776.1 hypothetical protein [Brevundimonas sp.]
MAMSEDISRHSSGPFPGEDTPAPRSADPLPELLEDGQEEVFSRSEVERGCIEHHVGEDDDPEG